MADDADGASHDQRASRRRMLRWGATGGVVAAGAALVGGVHTGAVHAQQTDPLVGTWLVTVAEGTGNTTTQVVSFTSDGVLIATNTPYSAGAQNGPSGQPAYRSAGQGAWVAQADGSYRVAFLELLYDTTGAFSGTTTFAVTLTVAGDGGSFSGDFGISFADANGNVLLALPAPRGGTLQGSRVSA